jgi:hypothetical protein
MDFRNSKLLEERIILEKHACKEGCKLIIDPSLDFKGDEARITRIQELLGFLESMEDNKVEVVFNEGMIKGRNLTILGDWFLAESVSGALGGYKQTVFTRHAPTVKSKKEAFDHEFESLMKNQKQDGKSSRKYAIERLNEILEANK